MNNKVVLKIVVICAALFLVFGILTAIFAARTSWSDHYNNGDFVIGRGEPFEYHKNEEVDLDGIKQINIDTVSTDVIFYESDGQLEITLDCEGYTKNEPITLNVTKTNTTVTAKIKYPTTFWGSLSLTKSLLEIGIPADYSQNLCVNGISGEILLEENLANNFSEVEFDTISGDIFIDCESIEVLKLNSTSGELNVENTKIDTLDADTTSGDIEIDSLSSDCTFVKANTVSGKVHITYDSVCKTNIDTTSGDVTLDIPEGSIINLDFDSTTGNLRGEYTSNSDGVLVEVDTTSGDLNIN